MRKSIVIIFGGFISDIGILNTAAVGRVFDLAKIIYGAGYKTIIVGLSGENDEVKKMDYCECFLLPKKKTRGIIEKIKEMQRFNYNLKKKLKQIFTENNVHGVFYHNAFMRFIAPSYKLVVKNGIPIGAIADDWYEYRGRVVSFLDSEVAWKVVYPQFKNFIVTSTYFEKYFSKETNNVMRVPAIFDCRGMEICSSMYVEAEIQIAYAGNMQNLKDRTDLVIKAIWLLKKDGKCNITFHLFGNTREQIYELMGNEKYILDDLKENIRFYGFVKKSELWGKMQNIDFTILIRPHMRYAEAGFATKFAESFVHGIPVIANLTSDIGLYLQDNLNGLIVPSDNVNDIANALQRAMNLSITERIQMRQKALETGREYFNLENYVDKMQSFMNDIRV